MKTFVLLFLAFSANLSLAEPPADLLLLTRTDQNSMDWFLQNTRTILLNSGSGDILNGEVPSTALKPTRIEFSALMSNHESAAVLNRLKRLTGVPAESIFADVHLNRVQYSLDSIQIRVLEVQSDTDIISMQLAVSIRGMEVRLPAGINAVLDSGKLRVRGSVNPIVVKVASDRELTIPLQLLVQKKDHIELQLASGNLDLLKEELLEAVANQEISILNQKGIPFSYADMNFVPLILSVGNAKMDISKDSLSPILENQIPSILRDSMLKAISSINLLPGSKLFHTAVQSEFETSSAPKSDEIYAKLSAEYFLPLPNNYLGLQIRGDVCVGNDYNRIGIQCSDVVRRNHKPIREYGIAEDRNARSELEQILNLKDAVLVTSISEDFLNRSIQLSKDMAFWDENLEEMNLSLANGGAAIHLNPNSSKIELVLHLEYVGEGIERIIAGPKRPLKFPLRLEVQPSFVQKDSPYLTLVASGVASDIEEIAFGIPEWGMDSRLKLPGFKRKIAKKILKMADEIKGKKLLELKLDVLKNSSILHTDFEVSKHGRLNILFKDR